MLPANKVNAMYDWNAEFLLWFSVCFCPAIQLNTRIEHVRGQVRQECADVAMQLNQAITEFRDKMSAADAKWTSAIGPTLESTMSKVYWKRHFQDVPLRCQQFC